MVMLSSQDMHCYHQLNWFFVTTAWCTQIVDGESIIKI
jgi:hypothetical protein